MSTSLVWTVFLLVVLILGVIGYRFSLRALRVVTAGAGVALSVFITAYGLAHPAKTPGSLSDAFARGADALSIAFFRTLPGRTGWFVIAVLLVIGYRELEAWALHTQARSLDTSALTDDKQDAGHDEAAGAEAVPDQQRHDRLAAELKFRLPAVEVRSPAILPGGSRSSGLASIAEASGVTGSGLAGAIINFFGMLWPGSRRLRVRVWVERTPGHTGIDDVTRVTVDLDDPRTGLSIATKTLAASGLDDAASVVAGYVARYIFAEDRTAPPWCTGAADGRDLAALLIARQVRDYPESEDHVASARARQIQVLEGVAKGHQCAGVARYELAQLYDLAGRHVEALLIHSINREKYPYFYRGRYRLAMSLEMIANAGPGAKISAAEAPVLDLALKILHRCCAIKGGPWSLSRTADGEAELQPQLQAALLDAAWDELHAIRHYLSLPNVYWRSFLHRDERGILKPYRRQRHRQPFHDGVCAALLLVAMRRAYIDPKLVDPVPRDPHRARTIFRIASAITGDASPLAQALHIEGVSPLEHGAPPVTRSLGTRHWLRPYRTRSWQAAYNLACAYAAVAQTRQAEGADQGELRDLTSQVVSCLEFAVCNPECEMERPWDWIANDPDFAGLHAAGPHSAGPRSGDEQVFAEFGEFLDFQKQRDYPSVPRPRAVASAPAVAPAPAVAAAPAVVATPSPDQPSRVVRPA
jgi:hypothetical protein